MTTATRTNTTRTKEIGLIQSMQEWVRLYTDLENKAYKVFPAPAERFGDAAIPRPQAR